MTGAAACSIKSDSRGSEQATAGLPNIFSCKCYTTSYNSAHVYYIFTNSILVDMIHAYYKTFLILVEIYFMQI